MTTAAKWLLVGRLRPSEHPLWSSFVWRNELADTFVEVVAAPWFARAATGHAGAQRVAAVAGRQDRPRRLVRDLLAARSRTSSTLRDGATVNPGCVVQTHLFHDRVLSMDR